MLKRCEFCNAPIFPNRPVFHELLCEKNTLDINSWTKEKKIRDDKSVNCMMEMVKNADIVDKMTYSELADFLVKSEWYANSDLTSIAGNVLDRILSILEDLDNKNKKI